MEGEDFLVFLKEQAMKHVVEEQLIFLQKLIRTTARFHYYYVEYQKEDGTKEERLHRAVFSSLSENHDNYHSHFDGEKYEIKPTRYETFIPTEKDWRFILPHLNDCKAYSPSDPKVAKYALENGLIICYPNSSVYSITHLEFKEE
mgnify:CR=1 FL=1